MSALGRLADSGPNFARHTAGSWNIKALFIPAPLGALSTKTKPANFDKKKSSPYREPLLNQFQFTLVERNPWTNSGYQIETARLVLI